MAYQSTTDIEVFLNDHIIPGVVADQIGDASAGLKLFMSSGRTDASGKMTPRTGDELLLGGKYLRRPLRFARATARGSWEGYDVLDVDPNRKYDYAREKLFGYNVALSWSLEEELEARGPEHVVNKMKNDGYGMVADMMDLLGTGIFNSAASRTGMQAKGIHGAREMCAIDRTWMSIDSTTYTWWDGGQDSTAYTIANLTDPTHANHILKVIRSLVDSVSVAGTRPTHIVTTQTIWNYIEDALRAYYNISNVADVGEIGWERLKFKGIEIYWDAYCPDDHLFALNFRGIGDNRTLGLKGRKGAWFTMTPWRLPHNQLAKSRFLITQAVLYCDNPRLQGMLSSVGAS